MPTPPVVPRSAHTTSQSAVSLTWRPPGKAPELNWGLKLKLSCYDQDRMGQDENLGVVFVPLAGLPLNRKRDIWVPLSPKIEGQPVSGDLRLRLLLTDR